MIENNEILKPVVAAVVLNFFVFLLKSFAPNRAYKQALKDGDTEEEASTKFKNEQERLFRLSRNIGPVYIWYIFPIILAIVGSYPSRAVHLSWYLVFAITLTGVFQAYAGTTPQRSWKNFLLFVPAMVLSMPAYIWLIYITVRAVF